MPTVAPGEGSAAVSALWARETVEDLELRRAAGEASSDLDAEVERLGLDFQISTRLTSWVAVSNRRTVDPSAPTRSTTMPHALPYGTSVEGFGLRAAAMPASTFTSIAGMPAPAPAGPPMAPAKAKRAVGTRSRLFERAQAQQEKAAAPRPAPADRQKGARPSFVADDDAGTFDLEAEIQAFEPAPLRVTGTWSRVGERWVIELAAPTHGFAWAPPPTVEVRLADGTTRILALEPGTTAAGSIGSGATIRLVVAAVADRTPIEVAIGDDLVVELHA